MQALDELWAVIQARRGADPEHSYTARLFAKGRPKIAQKVGEEAVETVIAALVQDKAALAAESADLLYHLLVLWADAGLDPKDVATVLETRRS
jgi:phosphoribosyl-ATP pyrophosphohydrolase